MKKHPILTVIIILITIVILMSVIMTALGGFSGRTGGSPFANKVGVIPVIGEIHDSTAILNHLKTFADDSSIKAIIIRIDSPGGGVGAFQEIYREIMKTREIKKVIVSLGGVAASGGFYIAAAGDKIVANPGTITGSIGVIMSYVQFSELAEKIGFSLEVIKSGEFKDIGSPHRELTERDKEVLKEVIDDIQNQFVNDVAEGRNLPPEKVREIADGRVFTGAMAKKRGLVDQLGNFEDAVSLAKELAGIEGEVSLIYPKRKRVRLLDLLIEEVAGSITRVLSKRMESKIEYRWNGFTKGTN
ncbi:signal peptide peptidase SppA [Thermodesulfobacteriota bacterium]